MTHIQWCAIGDSFTYLNDHPRETGYRVTKGYLTRTCEKVGGLHCNNIGINGATTQDWLDVSIPQADFYTILLGTNDWRRGILLGDEDDFSRKKRGTILGNLGILIQKIQNISPRARLLVMNPVERGDFVYVSDALENSFKGSYMSENNQFLKDISSGIYRACLKHNIPALDLYHQGGFTQENAVRFKRVKTSQGYVDYPYPQYTMHCCDYSGGIHPYPPEAADMTYDGLHPSDKGNEAIACCLAWKIRELFAIS